MGSSGINAEYMGKQLTEVFEMDSANNKDDDKKKIGITRKAIRKMKAPVKDNVPLKSAEAKEAPPAKAKAKAKEEKDEYLGYTPDELAKYREYKELYAGMTNNKLKLILKANHQSQTGTKDILIRKVADGKVLGAMPRCTKCGGGYLKWSIREGKYWCTGYTDDTEKVECDFVGKKEDVVRSPWVDPE
eukprot:TRINITY_DN11941_c0_g1_i4.p1 TRINITY_DN11941_c0_g1~~TRINITY_DN11941_c0_g1_i4.p1  ORF type:complete len:188 (-),score=71.56 TRINITY_DN11941_c0_g1_i4:154-717(-)